MKTPFSLLALSLFSPVSFLAFGGSAFASGQTITCFEINKSGSRKANGGTLRAELNLNKDGSLSRRAPGKIRLSGFFKRDAEVNRNVTDFYASESDPRGEVQYTHVSWYDKNYELMEMQLQFESRILGRELRDERATLVVGFEENSTEPAPSWGYDLECDGRVN